MNQVILGNCLDVMPRLIAEGVKVQMCVTSPPYWGLRDYGCDGQLGLEDTPEAYVENMVHVFRLVRDLLEDDGTLWLNLGDSYSGSGVNDGTKSPGLSKAAQRQNPQERPSSKRWNCPLKPKDLCGIPWRVAFALQANGWYLRCDIIWAKPNPMPESVRDRPTRSHEYVFLLSKSRRYYYDADAVKEECQSSPSDIRKMTEQLDRIGGKHKILEDAFSKASRVTHIGQKRSVGDPNGRNKRSVWTIATAPYPDAHFATFPPNLIKPCILASSRIGDVVFDPFMGSGTTGMVAEQLGRQWLGIELNPDYVEQSRRRTAQQGLFGRG